MTTVVEEDGRTATVPRSRHCHVVAYWVGSVEGQALCGVVVDFGNALAVPEARAFHAGGWCRSCGRRTCDTCDVLMGAL